jgi:hypothetical protein
MRLLTVALVLVVLGPLTLADAATAGDASKPVRVLGGPAYDYDYSAVEGYRSWIHAPKNVYHLMVKPAGQERYVVAKGQDVASGVDLALGTTLGDVLVFTGRPSADLGDTNVRIWDLDDKRLVRTPQGVNTNDPEGSPSISGHHLLFDQDPRNLGHSSKVILFDIATGRSTILARSRHGVSADSLIGDWATYTVYGETSSDVFRYRVSTGHARRIPHGRRYGLYSSTVTPNGVVYLSRGREAVCGGRVSIVRWTPHSRRTLARFADRFDVSSKDTLVEGTSVRLFFERITCTPKDTGYSLTYDIYRLDI